MTETTERPRAESEAPALSGETYRPLSLLALSGFGLAVLYALLVVIGGAIALFGRQPWLMPSWIFVLPLSALVVCWAARLRIRDSENTLSGLAFTTWGFRLVILFGLTYTAYYAATFFVVRSQAVECADRFFDLIKKEQFEKAFLLSAGIPYGQGDDADLRNTIEARFNTPSGQPGTPGAYSQFRQARFVRFIQNDSPNTQIAPLGVLDWEYAKEGYRVVLKYRITNSLGSFEMHVETLGRDPKPGEPKGRQWEIRLAKADTGIIPDSMSKTEQGQMRIDLSNSAHAFATAWVEKFNRQQYSEAYLDTLPAAERTELLKGQAPAHLLPTSPLAGLSPLALADKTCYDYLHAGQALASAKLFRFNLTKFWASRSQREEILKRIQEPLTASPVGKPTRSLALLSSMPVIRENEGRAVMVFDVNVNYLPEGNAMAPSYLVEGFLVVVEDEKATAHSPPVWRIESLHLESGRTAPAAPGRTPPPNMQMGGGMR
jgi:hypothetical protein